MNATLLDNVGRQTSGNDWTPVISLSLYDAFQETQALTAEFCSQDDAFQKFEKEMAHFEAEHEALLNEVRKHYVFSDYAPIRMFLSSRRSIPNLLLAASLYCSKYFGAGTVVNLIVEVDEEGPQMLYAVIMWPGKLVDIRDAFRRFDDEWWIPNSLEAGGNLTFTYELT